MNFTDVLLLGFLLGGFSVYYFLKIYRRRVLQERLKKARRGEKAAIHFLENQGYTIASIQDKRTIITWVDKAPYYNNVKADFLVKKSGRLYIAEVKTGEMAPKPTHADTRRQLLEYFLAYNAAGVLLVDMEKKKLHEVSFGVVGPQGRLIKGIDKYVFTALLGFLFGWLLFAYGTGGKFYDFIRWFNN